MIFIGNKQCAPGINKKVEQFKGKLVKRCTVVQINNIFNEGTQKMNEEAIELTGTQKERWRQAVTDDTADDMENAIDEMG